MKTMIYLISAFLLGLTVLTGGQPTSFQNSVYNDAAMIAKNDIGSTSIPAMATSASTAEGELARLTGSRTLLDWDAKEQSAVLIDSSLQVREGRCKLVHIAPDGTVTVLAENTGDSATALVLPKGRNRIKAVGLGADTSLRLAITETGKRLA